MNIGFISYWGWARGQAYVTKFFVESLIDEHDIFILKQLPNKISEEFKIDGVKITEHKDYIVPKLTLTDWIRENQLDAVVFNEYNQWGDDNQDLVQAVKDEGAKVFGYLVKEQFDEEKLEDYKNYDKILCPTMDLLKTIRMNKLYNGVHIPFGLDLNAFKPDSTVDKPKLFTFFHPGGFGGVGERKNTKAVIEAFKKMDNKDSQLIITSLKGHKEKMEEIEENVFLITRCLEQDEIIKLYQMADATVLPSKWETIGIPILESLACGTPVITSNTPPMNEFVTDRYNGLLATAKYIEYPKEVTCEAFIIDELDLRRKMEMSKISMINMALSNNSTKYAEDFIDIEKNKLKVKEVFK